MTSPLRRALLGLALSTSLLAGCAPALLVPPERGSGDMGLVIERESGSIGVLDTSARTRLGTIEGLGDPERLHPMQAAFLHHDGFQCGYCTPGQICSAVGMLEELKAGAPSHVTEDLLAPPPPTDAEIRERMSGNICRCAAYPNILAAIRDAGGLA